MSVIAVQGLMSGLTASASAEASAPDRPRPPLAPWASPSISLPHGHNEENGKRRGRFRRARDYRRLRSAAERTIYRDFSVYDEVDGAPDVQLKRAQSAGVSDADSSGDAARVDGRLDSYALFNDVDECPVDTLTWHAFSVPKRPFSSAVSVDESRHALFTPQPLVFQRLNIDGPEVRALNF